MPLAFPADLIGDYRHIDRKRLNRPTSKYADRTAILFAAWGHLKHLLPDLLRPGHQSVLDVSAGNGACLEILRHYGHTVFGIDYYSSDSDYDAYMTSQAIPHIHHDCRVLPLPVADKSFDTVLSIGAMTYYVPENMDVLDTWPAVLDDFARIATDTIALRCNHGRVLTRGRQALMLWQHDRFRLTFAKGHRFRWDAI